MIPHDFHFLRPGWLAALLLLVPLLWWAWRRPGHAAGWERVCEPHLLRHLLTTPGRQSLRWPFALFAIGWTAACIALAGPTWERLPQTAFKEPARTVFVLGLSPSMNQRDVAPSRLARARHKLLDALDQQKGGSFALVLYREEAYAASPLTDDAEVLREMIPLLDTTLTPGRQVHPARGLETAAELLEPVGLSGARILLVTDGADDDPARTRRVARELASRGAHLSVLSIAGTDASLAALASEGNGNLAVLTADGSDLAKLFDGRGIDFGSSLARSEIKTDEWRDMGAWLVWIPLLLAPLAFRKGWASAILLVAFLQIPTSPAEAGLRDWFERPDQRASRAFEAEDYETAARNFEDPAWQAAAHYRAGDYESAARALEGRTDPVSAYNRANALARGGRLEDALAAYDQALAQAPDDEDARFNRDLVARLLEEKKRKQEKSPQQGQTEQQDQEGASDAKDSPDSSDPSGSSGEDQEDGQKGDPTGSQDQASGGASDAPAASADPGPDPKDPGTRPDAGSSPDRASEGDRTGANEGASEPEEARKDSGQARPDPVSPTDRADASGKAGAKASEGDERKDPRESGSEQQDEGRGDPGERAMASADPQHESAAPGPPGSTPRPMSASEQDMARWMGRLPDDPAGLLREKIRRDYLRKQASRRKGDQP